MAQTTPRGKRPATLVTVTILLLVGVAGTLVVPIYARSTPKWGDFPFFYWYQLIWVPVVAVLCWLSFLLLRSRPTPSADTATADGEVAK